MWYHCILVHHVNTQGLDNFVAETGIYVDSLVIIMAAVLVIMNDRLVLVF